jgi:hypothetical protein
VLRLAAGVAALLWLSTLLIVVWALTGAEYFWPVWPIVFVAWRVGLFGRFGRRGLVCGRGRQHDTRRAPDTIV